MSGLALTTPQVWVAGRPLRSLCKWGALRITHRWPYGCWAAEWQVIVKPYQRIPAFTTDAPVEVRLGSGVFWAGRLLDFDYESGAMVATGLARQGEQALCLDSEGATTSTPDTAVSEAIGRGALDWTLAGSLSSTAFADGDETPQLNYVTALLDAWSQANGLRWAVDARGVVYAAADPTEPTLHVRPGAGRLGVTEKRVAGTIVGRYQTSGGSFDSVFVGSGRPEIGVSLAKHGVLDGTAATAICNGILSQLQERVGWTNGLTLTADMVTNAGGQRSGLSRVVAGRMARLVGLRDERGSEAHTDIVLSQTIWDVTAGTVQADPVGLDDRSLAGVVESAGGELLGEGIPRWDAA